MREFLRRFFDNMSNPPEPGPELIPTRWRVPFFIGLAIVSLIALALLVWFVVLPGVSAQQSGTSGVRESGSVQ